MNNLSEKLKKRLSNIFLKKGGEGIRTKLFENLLLFEKEKLLRKKIIKNNESPIIGSYKNENEWLILTSDELAWQRQDRKFSLLLSEIKNADVNFDKMVANNLTMNTVQEIEIELNSSERVILEMESGYPLSGMWNILLHLSWRNSKNR